MYALQAHCKAVTVCNRPRFPPAKAGEAEQSIIGHFSQAIGVERETQSIRFFSVPGVEKLYSGEEMIKPSALFN